LPPEARRPYHLIIDEAGSFASQSATAMERILTQTAKFGLSLTLSCQTVAQARHLRSALQNVGVFVSFRLGHEDAEIVTPRLFAPDPYRVKHEVADPYGATRSHPLYMSASEQRAEFIEMLQTLPPREALVRVGGRTERIRTPLMPEPRGGPVALAAIKERYAQLLLTPRERIEADWQAGWGGHGEAAGRTGHLQDDAGDAQPPHPGRSTGSSGTREHPRTRRRATPLDESDD
jgi:hypothetical protein